MPRRANATARLVMFVLLMLVVSSSLTCATTLQIWIESSSTKSFLEQFYMPEFGKAYPDTEIEFLIYPLQEVFDRLVAGVVTGSGPDIISTGNTTVFNLSNVGLLMPIDRYLAEWDGYSAVWPGAWFNQRFDGVTYGIPMYSAARGICYRADAAREVGLDAERPPQSWIELREWARRLTRVENDRLLRAGYVLQGNDYQEWVFWLNQAGGALISEDLRTPTFNSKAGAEAISQMLELVRVSRFQDLGSPPATGARGLASDAVGMVIGNSGTLNSVLAADRAAAESMRIFAPRKDPESPPVALTFTDGWAIPATAKNPDLAWAFLRGLMDRKMAAQLINSLGRIVPRKDLVSLITVPHYLLGYRLLEHFVPYPTLPEGAWLGTAFRQEFTKVMRGELSPEAVLSELETGYIPRLREYWQSVDHNK